MELQTITQVTKQLSITKRTLQHYEQLGLITSTKKEGYAYRVYDAAAIIRIRQIQILRKLRIPLKQIAEVLQSDNTTDALKMFESKLGEIDDEVNALSTIRGVIESFIKQLSINTKLELLDDESVLKIVNSIKLSKTKFNEEKELILMESLNQAKEVLANRVEVLRNYIDELFLSKIQQPEIHLAYAHLQNVSLASVIIAKKRGLDAELAAMAGMMHDIYSFFPGDPSHNEETDNKDHAGLGSVIARRILNELKITTQEETDIICSGINRHSSKLRFHSSFDELIKDADVLATSLSNPTESVECYKIDRYNELMAEFNMGSIITHRHCGQCNIAKRNEIKLC